MSPADFSRFELFVFMCIEGSYIGVSPWIDKVYSSDGQSEHRLIFDASGENILCFEGDQGSVDSGCYNACRDFLAAAVQDTCTIEQTRKCVLQFLDKHGYAK